MSNTQYSLTTAFNTVVRKKYNVDDANSIINNFWVKSYIYVFEYAPFLSGLGAVCYAMTSIISADILSILINRNLIIFFNITIGISGGITMAEWIMPDVLINWVIDIALILSGKVNLIKI
jgi:hypothetical protein